MSLHFTYAQPDRTRLCQGDVLKRTPSLETLLKGYFPYYLEHSDYKYFIVTTQSCDLVRHDGRSVSAQYISLSPVRPLKQAIEREIEKLRFEDWEKKFHVVESSRRPRLNDFMERLLNNNEADYFFLFRQSDCELDDDYCAFLKLSIAFKIEHYETLLESKILQLDISFQHKLGYNVGHSFARIGTTDWHGGKYESKKEFHEKIEELIRPFTGKIAWTDRAIYNELKKYFANYNYQDTTEAQFLELYKLKKGQNKTNKQQALNMIRDVMNSSNIPKELADTVTTKLNNSPNFMALIK